jgi:hypothetical protein
MRSAAEEQREEESEPVVNAIGADDDSVARVDEGDVTLSGQGRRVSGYCHDCGRHDAVSEGITVRVPIHQISFSLGRIRVSEGWVEIDDDFAQVCIEHLYLRNVMAETDRK